MIILLFLTVFGSTLSAQQTVGLFLNDSNALNGYTLISPNGSTSDYLIDNCGFVVNKWTSDYAHGEAAYLLENGNLLRTARISSSFQAGGTGGRIEIYNWDGDLIWGYNYSTADYHHHHDVEILPNGNILLIAWELRTFSEAVEAGRNPSQVSNTGVWSERVVEIEPIGTDQANIVWEWHLWDHLIQDFDPSKANYGVVGDHPEKIDINYAASTNHDWIHLNAVAYNAELDQVIINSHVFNEFWIIDHSTTTAEAATGDGGNSGNGGDILYRWGNPQTYDRGLSTDQKLFGQHDAHWVAEGYPDEGKIMVYNNGQGRPEGLYSSVDVIDPPVDSEGNYQIETGQPFGPAQLFWTYDGQPGNAFYSSRISGANRLSNGNTLICVGRDGHIFEIDPEGNKVWDYINPVRPSGPVSQGTVINNNSVFRSYRYAPDFPAFEGKDLTPGDPIELNPLPSDCQIYEQPVSASNFENLKNLSVVENPFNNKLVIENATEKQIHIQIVNLIGQNLFTGKSADQLVIIETNNWVPGLYLLRISDLESKQFYIQKIIKQ